MKQTLFICAILFSFSCSVINHKNEFILNGQIKRSDLKTHFAWFDKNYNAYQPNDSTINLLKPYANDIYAIVVLGTWCSDSKEHVPEFFKVADAIGLPDNKIEMVAVDRKKQSEKFNINALKITNVPTFIFFYKGRQMGSIIETPNKSIEKDLLHIIRVIK